MRVIITGASKGIGRAIAEKFAAGGHELFLCARNEVDLYNTLAELQTAWPDAGISARPADLADPAQVKDFANWCLERAVPDVLINNAGQFLPGSIHSEEEGLLEQMIAVNMYSAYHLSRAILPKMMERKSGQVFNLCSIASIQPYANGGSYSISKFALLGFSKNLREEMKPHGIKVTAICPGGTYTPSWEPSGVDPERLMDAADVAEMIYAAARLSPRAVLEDMVLRPQLGDL